MTGNYNKQHQGDVHAMINFISSLNLTFFLNFWGYLFVSFVLFSFETRSHFVAYAGIELSDPLISSLTF